jgi:FkbM family methyltransferase
MQFVTSCYGDAYAPFLAVCLRSLRNSNPRSSVLVLHDEIAGRTIEALSEINPNAQFVHLALAPPTQDLRQRIGAKASFWLAAMERTQADEIIFLDCDMIVRSSLRDALPSLADALFTVKDEKVPINTGLVIIRRSDRTQAFMTEWDRVTQQVCRQTSVDYSTSGGPTQHALLLMMGTERPEPGNITVEAGGNSVAIHLAPCAIYNETNSVPLSSPAKVLHYKSGWRKILLNGSGYTRTRPQAASMEMRRLWREHLLAEERATGLRLLPTMARLKSAIRDMLDYSGPVGAGVTGHAAETEWGAYRLPAIADLCLAASRYRIGPPQLRKRLRKIVDNGRCCDVEITGIKMRCHTRDNDTERKIVEQRQKLLPEIAAITSDLRPGDTFVDVGANCGLFTLFAARQVGPKGRVLAVEPIPELQSRLKFNIKANGFGNIDVLETAVGPEIGTTTLHVKTEQFGQSSVHHAEGWIPTAVSVTTLLEVIEGSGVERVGAMKIDIEGYEDEALIPFIEAAPRRLWPGRILMETKHRHRWRRDLGEVLAAAGYQEKWSSARDALFVRQH